MYSTKYLQVIKRLKTSRQELQNCITAVEMRWSTGSLLSEQDGFSDDP